MERNAWLIVAIPLTLIGSCAAFAIALLIEAEIFNTLHTLHVWIWPGIHLSGFLPRRAPPEILKDLGSHFDWTGVWLSVLLWWAVTFIGAVAWRIRKPNRSMQPTAKSGG